MRFIVTLYFLITIIRRCIKCIVKDSLAQTTEDKSPIPQKVLLVHHYPHYLPEENPQSVFNLEDLSL